MMLFLPATIAEGVPFTEMADEVVPEMAHEPRNVEKVSEKTAKAHYKAQHPQKAPKKGPIKKALKKGAAKQALKLSRAAEDAKDHSTLDKEMRAAAEKLDSINHSLDTRDRHAWQSTAKHMTEEHQEADTNHFSTKGYDHDWRVTTPEIKEPKPGTTKMTPGQAGQVGHAGQVGQAGQAKKVEFTKLAHGIIRSTPAKPRYWVQQIRTVKFLRHLDGVVKETEKHPQ